jgi:hypothetical protein
VTSALKPVFILTLIPTSSLPHHALSPFHTHIPSRLTKKKLKNPILNPPVPHHAANRSSRPPLHRPLPLLLHPRNPPSPLYPLRPFIIVLFPLHHLALRQHNQTLTAAPGSPCQFRPLLLSIPCVFMQPFEDEYLRRDGWGRRSERV